MRRKADFCFVESSCIGFGLDSPLSGGVVVSDGVGDPIHDVAEINISNPRGRTGWAFGLWLGRCE